MLKHLAAAALSLCAVAAQAQQVRTWNFDWTGAFFSTDSYSIENHSFKGSFSAIDANGDNVIVASELKSLKVNLDKFLPCDADRCEIDDFNYSSGASPVFTASISNYRATAGGEKSWYGTHYWWDSRWNVIENDLLCSMCSISTIWQAQGAKLTITEVTAVPEPATYAMLLAGLGIAGATARRRRA